MTTPNFDSGEGLTPMNEFNQPVGVAMDNWTPPPFPPCKTLIGSYCQVEPFQTIRHAQKFWEALSDDLSDARWTYMGFGRFPDFEDFKTWCMNTENYQDPQLYATVVDGHAVGLVAYMRIDCNHGVIEVGRVVYSPRLVKTRAATEAMYLLANNVFQLGYRRFEWKCDSFNMASRLAASRLGFTYKGMFRQAIIYKGRTRDTTWFSIIDADWNAGLKEAYTRWS
ncbi:hypothetical protein BBO99_00008353 [Phytophthora kernoviae]|uniref:N-acetyltransferase domain-containing protein n=2 Tax=Phytophthora kernoviae TaxID=325452 RepID=A0A3R7J3H3_9STRA|nr:hypothetical protein G195_009651 [Phytophthora kernoviae 00238/432]KAG2517229.1 hypothetical protein JM16_007480 [Phytophthora kernoviae]KAG2519083.1 hypothetical protein JM18_007447 [Phytophthora kernoviae]RLN38254.1 hypothetical protein BBI17_008153 [Phytophthora kernoviae]RLN75409.1 hypothetical protein BBO99_00008353 [Phytophthora kernoviae]